MPEASHTFDARAGSVRAARHFLRGCLQDWQAEGFGLSGEQVVSELATNAALHAPSECTVHIRLDPDSLLAEDWGVQAGPTGKTVWTLAA